MLSIFGTEVSPSQSQQSTPAVTPLVDRRAATKEDQIDSTATSFESESPLERSMAAASFSESSFETVSPVTDRPLRSVQSTTQLTYDACPATERLKKTMQSTRLVLAACCFKQLLLKHLRRIDNR